MTILEILEAVSNNGFPIVISSLAIWFVVYNYLRQEKREIKDEEKRMLREEDIKARDMKFNESLQMLSKAIDNQTKTLELLKSSIDKNETLILNHDEKMTALFSKHDDRAILIKEDLVELKSKRSKK